MSETQQSHTELGCNSLHTASGRSAGFGELVGPAWTVRQAYARCKGSNRRTMLSATSPSSRWARSSPRRKKKTGKKKTKRELYEENLAYKKRISALRQENKSLRTSTQRLTHLIKRKERGIDRVRSLTAEQSESTPRLIREIRSDMVSIASLNEKIRSLEENLKERSETLRKVTMGPKYTRIHELQVERKTYTDEVARITATLNQFLGPQEPLNSSRSARPPARSALSARGPRSSRRGWR